MSIAVIIPSKTIGNLKPCVEAIERNTHPKGLRIIVVNDGIEYRDRMDMNCAFIDGQSPFIFSRNINAGINHAYSTGGGPQPDGVVLLNDDALLQTPGGFTLLAQAAAENPEYGIIAATTNVVGNPNQLPRGIGLREEPRMICFVAVYIPRSTIETVGLLDPTFEGYGLDDDDYCLRVRNAGLKIGIHDGCYVDHESLKSTYRGDPTTPADFQPNLKRFKNKWGVDNWGNPA